jgi:hypothetical protein
VPAWEWCLLAVVLVYGLLLRSWDLGSRPYWVDEAETGINALTILEHGLPVDHYLALPIFDRKRGRSSFREYLDPETSCAPFSGLGNLAFGEGCLASASAEALRIYVPPRRNRDPREAKAPR